MDDIYQISTTLENSELDQKEKKDLLDKLKINLIEIQDEIDIKESQFNYILDKKINKYKKLLQQVSDEITENENSYLIEKNDYMFPDNINLLNKELNDKIIEIQNKTLLKNNKKTELNILIKKKMELNEEYRKNKDIINSKKRKIENNLEITALLEKKNKLIGNKKKNFNEMNKNIENEEKRIKNLKNKEKKDFEFNKKKINNQIETTNKLLVKTINGLKNHNPNSKEYKIKNKEIDSLNDRMNKLNNDLEVEEKKVDDNQQEILKIFNNFKEFEQEKLETENKNIDDIIILIDESFHVLNNFFINLKEKNLGIVKELNVLEKEIQNIEKDIFSINLDKIIEDKLFLEDKLLIKQDKSCHKYLTFKNMYDNKMDDLINKKNKIINKIESLSNLQNNDIDFEELVNSKNYIYKILNGNY